MSQPDFLTEFQTSMDKLTQFNDAILQNVENRKQSSNIVVERLVEINKKIQGLAGKINELKNLIGNLQNKVTSNASGVSNKEAEIDELTDKVQQLETEKQEAQQQLETLTQQTTQESKDKQANINALESKIQQLTADNNTLKTQSESLTQELSGKGDLEGKHAEAIKSQTESAKKQIAALTQDNINKIQELTTQINEKEVSIKELQENLQKAQQAAAGHVDSIEKTKGETTTQIDTLNQQIQELKTQNDILKQKIMDATIVINDVTKNLDKLTNKDIDEQNMAPINNAFAEIDKSIQAIYAAIDASPPSGTTPLRAPMQGTMMDRPKLYRSMKYRQEQFTPSTGTSSTGTSATGTPETEDLSHETGTSAPGDFSQENPLMSIPQLNKFRGMKPKLPLNTTIIFKNNPTPLESVIKQIKTNIIVNVKNTSATATQTKLNALETIYNASSISEIHQALLLFNNAKGGNTKKSKKSKKTRKLRKQKGGFRYNSNAKRRSVHSSRKR